MHSLLISSLNLLILIAILVYKLRFPVSDFVQQRHHAIRLELKQVRDQLHQAQEQYNDFSAKLRAIDAETATLRDQAQQDVQALEHRMVQESRRITRQVVSDARAVGESLVLELKSQLYTDWSLQVLERAESLLKERLTGDDQVRIRQEFSQQMETMQ